MQALKRSLSRLSAKEAGILAILFVIAAFLFAYVPVTYKDWLDVFRPASLNLENPYFQPGLVFNPPWIFPILFPIAILPARLSAGVLMVVSLIAISAYVKSPKKILAVALSAPLPTLITLGQLDALLLFAFMLPYGLGVPFMLAKPQGVFLAIIPRLNRISIVVTLVVVALSVLIWGAWWTNILGTAPNQTVNFSLFPYSIIPGLVLAWFGYKRKSDALLCFASLCFAPYFMITSALPAIAATIRETENWRIWVAVAVGSWIYYFALRFTVGF